MDIRIFTKVKEGSIIPLFSLKNTRDEVICSEDFLRKKNLIIFFFNRLDDACCVNQIKMLNSIYEELRKEGAEVLAISQGAPDTLREFIEKEGIKFNLLLDRKGEVINKFTYKDKQGNNICALFITDKFGSLYKCYLHRPFGELPGREEIIGSAEFLEKQCPECGVSNWPQD